MLVLVLEASTTSAKALVYSSQTGVLRLEACPFPPEISNGVTQEPEGICRLLFETGRKAAAGLEIAGVSIVGTWHSTLLCQRGLPISPIYTWAHLEAAPLVAQYQTDQAFSAQYFARTGCRVHASYPAFRLRFLRAQGWDLDRLEISSFGDYVFSRLTGERATSRNMASGSGLMNIHSLEWDETILAAIGLNKEQLPPVQPSRFSLPLQPAMADCLGIAAGIPVALPFADGCVNQLGAGALAPGRLTLSAGTSCAIRSTVEKPAVHDPDSGIWCYYGVDSWLAGAATNGGTSCLDWFRQQMAPQLTLGELDRLAADPVEQLPVFLPFINGERSPGWKDRRLGGFLNVSALHSQGNFSRAILEGVLFNVRQCFEALARQVNVKSINLSGGILYSPVWRQMAADILQRDLEIPPIEQASLLGGAYLGLYVLGEQPDLQSIRLDSSQRIYPNAERAPYYQDHYGHYLKAYHQTID